MTVTAVTALNTCMTSHVFEKLCLVSAARELTTTVYATYWTTAYPGPQLRIRMQLVRLKSRYVKAVGVSAYCVLRITSWRAVLKAACGRPAYSAPVLRIELWAVVSAACDQWSCGIAGDCAEGWAGFGWRGPRPWSVKSMLAALPKPLLRPRQSAVRV